MGTSDLPEMHAQSPRMQPEDCGSAFQVNYECPYYNYSVLCNTFVKANILNANTSTSTGFFTHACLKDLIMVMQQVTLLQ